MVRKSFEGLDNYVKEGCRGFTHLESLLEKLHVDINVDEYNKYKEGLQKGKRYLKYEFKVRSIQF